MTEIVRVQPKYLHHRLDVRYNSPSAVNARMAIASSGLKVRPVGQLLELVCGPFGSTLTSDEHCPHGEVLLVQPTNLSGELFSDDTSWRITKNDLVEKGLKLYTEGTLLFARVGIYPHTGVLPQGCGLVTISSSMIAGIPVKSIDTYYLASFFQSAIGYQLLLAAQKVTAQPTIGTSEIGATEVPVPQELVQKYIGDKVRQAELLRAWAKKVEADITVFHQQLIPDQSKLDFSRKTRFVGCVRMTERFDAHFYPGVVEDYLSLKNCGFKPLGELASTVFNGQTQDETEGAGAVEQITVANLSRTYINGQPRRVIKPSNSSKLTKKHDLLICNAAHNKSYIGRDVTYYHSEKSVLPSTEVMVIRVDRELLPASFVRSYLLTQLGFVQIQSTIRGITAHSYPIDMKKLDIPIPSVPDSLKHDWFACDDRMALAGHACEVATRLTCSAKFLVEALIEGLVTEQQLICAQQALDADDNSLEREILGRLTTKGLDGDGDPLFADLDQLYDLLAQCQQMDE